MIEVGAAPAHVIELRRGPADGARLAILIQPPEYWEVGEVPTTMLPTNQPGVLIQVPLGKIKVHRYRRTEEMTTDGQAVVYDYDRTFP